MRRVRLPDLSVSFERDDALLLRSLSSGRAARAPAIAVGILAFCGQPRTEEEVADTFGPNGRLLFQGLANAGFLVSAADAAKTPVMFSNYAQIDVHRRMLGDTPRVEGFRDALRALVGPDTKVLDAGTGTGVLAAFAARAGAAHVYAVDNSDAHDLARAVFEASDIDADKITLIRGDFTEVTLPEKVDVIVSETIGGFALAEGGGPDLVRCAEKNLAEGGRVIPYGVDLILAPMGDERFLRETIDPFKRRDGVALDVLATNVLRRARTEEISPDQVLHEGLTVAAIPWPTADDVDGRAVFEGLTPGVAVHGFGGWFTLRLAPGVDMPSGPADPLTHWKQVYFPMETFHVGPDGVLAVDFSLRYSPEDRRGIEVDTTWTTGGAEYRGSHRVR